VAVAGRLKKMKLLDFGRSPDDQGA